MTILSKEDALAAAQVMLDKKAQDVILLEVGKVVTYADYFLIGSGRSTVQVKAIANALEDHFRTKKVHPLHVEGLTHARWILLDYDELIIHVFLEEAREFYNLERLWTDVPQTEFEEEQPPASMASFS